MKVKIIYQESVKKEDCEIFEKNLNSFFSTIEFDFHIFKIEHFCYGEFGLQIAVIYYHDFENKSGE